MESTTKLNRHQLRTVERIKEEADKLHERLCHKYVTFFMENEPHSFEVEEYAKQLSAKWKVFCHHNRINKDYHESVKKFIEEHNKKYNELHGPFTRVDWEQEALRINKAKIEMENQLIAQLNKIPAWIRKMFKAL